MHNFNKHTYKHTHSSLDYTVKDISVHALVNFVRLRERRVHIGTHLSANVLINETNRIKRGILSKNYIYKRKSKKLSPDTFQSLQKRHWLYISGVSKIVKAFVSTIIAGTLNRFQIQKFNIGMSL